MSWVVCQEPAILGPNLVRIRLASIQSVTRKISRRPIRLLNPLELINLMKMTFPGAEAKVDDQGNFVIKGVDRREGVVRRRNVARRSAASEETDPLGIIRASTRCRLLLEAMTFSLSVFSTVRQVELRRTKSEARINPKHLVNSRPFFE